MSSVKAFLQLARWQNALMAAAGVFVGAYALTGSELGGWLDLPRLAAAIACALALTVTANAWNDAADGEIDRIAHPERPVASGQISALTARRIALGCGVLGIVCASLIALSLGAITVVVVLLMLAYSPWLKRAGPVGNVTAALLASLPFLYGAWSSGVPENGVAFAIWAFFLHLAREIAKDIDDAAADAGHRRTMPLRWDPRTVKAIVVGALLIFIAPALAFEGLFWTMLPALVAVTVGGYRVIRGEPGAPRAFKAAMLLAMLALVLTTAVPALRPFII